MTFDDTELHEQAEVKDVKVNPFGQFYNLQPFAPCLVNNELAGQHQAAVNAYGPSSNSVPSQPLHYNIVACYTIYFLRIPQISAQFEKAKQPFSSSLYHYFPLQS